MICYYCFNYSYHQKDSVFHLQFDPLDTIVSVPCVNDI